MRHDSSPQSRPKWGPSLGICERCERLRKVRFIQRVNKWLCRNCEKVTPRV